MEQKFTVASYLKARLEEIGVKQLFSTTRSKTNPFLNSLLSDRQTPIRLSVNDKLIHAYCAANAYARQTGMGVLYVEGNGGELRKAIASAYAEQLPLLLVGSEQNEAERHQANALALAQQPAQQEPTAQSLFASITTATETIIDSDSAAQQIDAVLIALLLQRGPVHLHLQDGVLTVPCEKPQCRLPSTKVHSSRTSRRVLGTCEKLVRDLAQTPSLAELARSVGTNRNTLTEEFRAAFGLSPFAWLREQRLQRARQLMFETDWPLYRIGEAIGYADANHFSTSFKKRFGASPRALRRKCIKLGSC